MILRFNFIPHCSSRYKITWWRERKIKVKIYLSANLTRRYWKICRMNTDIRRSLSNTSYSNLIFYRLSLEIMKNSLSPKPMWFKVILKLRSITTDAKRPASVVSGVMKSVETCRPTGGRARLPTGFNLTISNARLRNENKFPNRVTIS